MKTELSPITSIAILAFFIGLIAVAGWLYGRSLDVPRLSFLHVAPNGDLVAMLGDRFYRYDRDGRFRGHLTLREAGLNPARGDFGFLSDGDMLIRAGVPENGIGFNLKRFLRMTNDTPGSSDSQAHNLVRCPAGGRDCAPFAEPPLNLNDLFRLTVDWHGKRVFVSDGSRHRILMLGADGRHLDTVDDRLRFPNGLSLRDGLLFVANTNRHRISVYAIDPDRLRALPDADIRVKRRDLELNGHVWPTAVLVLEEQVWVITNSASFESGITLRFDRNGEFLGRLDMPPDSDPLSLALFGGKVLIADSARNRVLQYDIDGRRLADFDLRAMAPRFTELATERNRYRFWMWLTVGLLVAGLAAGLFVGARQTILAGAGALSVSSDKMSLGPDDPGIHWIPRDASYERLIRSAIWVTWLGVVLLPLLFYSIGAGLESTLRLGGAMLVMLLYVYWLSWSNRRPGLGVKGDLLVVKQGRTRAFAGKGRRIRYSSNYLAVDDMVVALHANRGLFDESELVKNVYPLLKDARHAPNNVLRWLFFKGRPDIWLGMPLSLLLFSLLLRH